MHKESHPEQKSPDLPPEAKDNTKWRDTTDAIWMRSSLFKDESEAVIEAANFDDGFRAVRDGKSPEKGTLFFTPAEWEAFALGARDGEFDIPEKYLTEEERRIQRGEVDVEVGLVPSPLNTPQAMEKYWTRQAAEVQERNLEHLRQFSEEMRKRAEQT